VNEGPSGKCYSIAPFWLYRRVAQHAEHVLRALFLHWRPGRRSCRYAGFSFYF
jgi:hypothetical protein